jgi:hypothetical protein
VSRRSSTREQENPEVHRGVSIANKSSSIVSSHKSTTSSNSYSSLIVRARPQHLKKSSWTLLSSLFGSLRRNIVTVAKPTIIAKGHHEEHPSGHLPPTATLPSKLLRHPRNLITVELFSSPILFIAGIHFPPVLLYNQGYPKVCPDSLNLPNTGDPFAGISSLSSYSLFSPTRDLIALI